MSTGNVAGPCSGGHHIGPGRWAFFGRLAPPRAWSRSAAGRRWAAARVPDRPQKSRTRSRPGSNVGGQPRRRGACERKFRAFDQGWPREGLPRGCRMVDGSRTSRTDQKPELGRPDPEETATSRSGAREMAGQVEGATSCPARSVPSTRSAAVALAGTCAGVDSSREVTNTGPSRKTWRDGQQTAITGPKGPVMAARCLPRAGVGRHTAALAKSRGSFVRPGRCARGSGAGSARRTVRGPRDDRVCDF